MSSPSDTHDIPSSDDELGAALGASIRSRADAVPTITPGFETVERRARQITNRRRALAGAAVGAATTQGQIDLGEPVYKRRF